VVAPGPFDITTLLQPRSVALIGASEASLWSQALVANFGNLGFQGRLHLVHPARRQQFGRVCYPNLESIPDAVDSAYVMTGAQAAEAVIEDCGRKGVRSAVMLTAGFKEVGPEGLERERRLVTRCRELGITLLGPNCLGFVNYQQRVPAFGLLLTPPLKAGGIAIVSQSGGLLAHYHRLAQQRGIGLACTVSIGNEAMCTGSDFLRHFVECDGVRVVGALLEGIRDPSGFLAAADAALERGKPIVVLKVGRGEVGARAIAAHTGSLAGAEAVVDAVFRQKGIIRVDSVEELIETCALIDLAGWPRGARTAVVTTSGGASGLVSYLAHGSRIEIPDYGPETKERLSAVLPAFGTAQNPLDTTGVIVDQPGLLAACVGAVVAEGRYDALFINADPPREPGANAAAVEERMRLLAETVHRSPVFTALAQTVAGELTPFAREALERHGLHFANGLTLGVAALDHAISYGQAATRRARRKDRPRQACPGGEGLKGLSGTLSESASKRLLAAYGIGAPPERLAGSAQAAAAAAREIGFPVVLKVQSPDIAHKSEAGGLKLGLTGEEAVRQAYRDVTSAQPGARIEGVLVARQVDPLAELIAGVKRDPLFGPVVLVGMGGIFTETIRDTSLRLPPLDTEMALEMIRELRGVPVLTGARGRPAADLEALAAVLVGLGELALDLGDRLLELDVNPLFALPDGAVAGDALVVLRD
jgi:acyl-CoA synthetase (NDP forming)